MSSQIKVGLESSHDKKSNETNPNKMNSNSQKDLEAKKSLREQAKQLLLKGCYRMASNKYLQLIKMGINEFLPRQQAIIYLNCGICFQFMSEDNQSNFVQALEFMKNAILIDITYEKTYYRLVQLLRDNGNYQSALSIVPSSIKNKQIDELLKEVRQQYMKKSDFSRMIEKMSKKQLTLGNGKMLCSKLAQTVEKFLSDNQKKIVTQYEGTIIKARQIGNQIGKLYEIIAQNEIQQIQNEISQTRKALMQDFMSFLSKLFVIKLDDRLKVPVVDELLQSSLKKYRGQLSKFLQFKVWFKVKDIKLLPESKFTSQNQFTLITKRKNFYDSQLRMIKFARLVDVNMQLFGKTYCYLSNKAYEGVHQIILKKPQSKTQDQIFDYTFIHKFLLSNSINAVQVISKGLNKKEPKIKYFPVFGGHPLYLYENIQINELNYLKEILVEECHKISQIYESAIIHPLWMEKINEVLYSAEGLLNIILSMVQVYSSRDSKNINSLVNKLNDIYELIHLIYIYYWELYAYKEKQKQQEKDESDLTGLINQITPPFYSFNYSFQKLLNYFDKQNYNFIVLYLVQKIIQFNLNQPTKKTNQTQKTSTISQNQNLKEDFNNYKERAIEICLNKITLIRNKINEKKKSNLQQNYVFKEMYLILISIVLKLDIKRKIQIDTEIIFNTVLNQVTSDIALQGLLLILINDQNSLKFYIENQSSIRIMVQNFISKSFIEKIDSFKVLLNIIYIMACDFETDQETYFAKKLGVSQKEVHQVRMLQKQSIGNKQKQELTKVRRIFRNQMATQWSQILNKLCKILRTTLKMQSYCSSKLCRIIFSIAQINYQKLYSNQIIDFMLEARNIKESPNNQLFNTKQTACRFFQIICKKCNPQIFEYKHLQAIVDSLLWLISNCEHELVYFQSLLGLVNLSTMSVRIPVQEIQKCLYEQNSYIMHAGVCVLNNIMIYNEQLQEQDPKSLKIKKRISDIIHEYIEFYRDQILNLQSQLPQTDYSHPKKIYNSLISLATVLKLDKVQQLTSWNQASKFVKIMTGSQASQLLFKLAIYHSLQQKLPKGWYRPFQTELQTLKKFEPQKYAKLAQLM